jgi:ribose transport system substrate-binding protein
MRFAAFLFAAACLVGCGGNQSPATKPAKTITLGMIAKSQDNDVFQAAHKGARDAAVELGAKYGVKIDVKILTPAKEDPQKQADAVMQLASQGVDGIAVSCSDAKILQTAIDKAVDMGVPVMCFDSDSAASKRFAYYGTDDAACGKLLAQELAKAMGDKGNIAILAGNETAPNLQARAKAVKDEIAGNHPQMKVIGTFYHKENSEEAAATVQRETTAHPEIQGWAFIGGWPLFTRDALKWPAGQIKCVSVDGLPAMFGYLKDGHVDELLAQDCYGWGAKSVAILMEKIINKKEPSPLKVIDPLTPVTTKNVDEFAKKWQVWLGTGGK